MASILYLPGFGDSFLNHNDFFERLCNEGYEIISFDYPGSGASYGPLPKLQFFNKGTNRDLTTIAKFVWNTLATRQDKRISLSWCIGSLIAIQLAHENWLSGAIHIAPSYQSKISTIVIFHRERHLSSASVPESDHLVPIRPQNPLQNIAFALNIKISARKIQKLIIPKTVKGVVFYTGIDDRFMFGGAHLRNRIQETAPHFTVLDYAHAKHEVHNEREEIKSQATREIFKWLKNNFGSSPYANQ